MKDKWGDCHPAQRKHVTTMMFQRTVKAVASTAKNMKDKSKITRTDYEVTRIILFVFCVCVFILQLNSYVLTCNEVNQVSFNAIINLQKQAR